MNSARAVCFLLHFCRIYGNHVEAVFEWTNLEFDYTTNTERQAAIDQGVFMPGNPRLSDVDVYYDDRGRRTVFVTAPRYVSGVPATLGIVTDRLYNGDPIIAPYPSWEWQNWNSCPEDRLVSVLRIRVDELKRLWVLDTGSVLGQQKCPAQILAFDLKTNTRIHRYEIPDSQMQFNSILNNPIVDVRDYETGSGTFVYITDTRGFAIIVYDVDNNQSWKITDKTFHASPDYGTYCVPDAEFDLMDGIQGAALSPYQNGKDRVLYYHALASNSEQWVWTSLLRNRTAYLTTTSPNPKIFNVFCGRRNTQASVIAIDSRGVMYFGLGYDTSLNCWNTNYPYGPQNIRQLYKSYNIQYISGIKIVENKDGLEELWFTNTRVKRIVTGPTNDNIVNFRVHKTNLSNFYRECRKGSCRPYYQSYNCPSNICSVCVNKVI